MALDSETSALYCRDGYMLGFSMSYKSEHGVYVDCECIDEVCEALMQQIFDKKIVVFHNAKFDYNGLSIIFGFKFPHMKILCSCTICLMSNPGTHGLKQLALKHTPYGDYEAELDDWITDYRKQQEYSKNLSVMI